MIRNYMIVRQATVNSAVEECWRYLTEPGLIGEWFADVTGGLGTDEAFEFHFGDGDFFRGVVEQSDAPVSLRFQWRFMGVGLTSAIEYALLPYKDGSTLVTVIDRGEHTPGGAVEMCEGWDDFLTRLERRLATGANSRYRWTERIGCGTVLACTPSEAIALLCAPTTWASFADTAVAVEVENEAALTVTMSNPAWGGQTTRAGLRFRPTAAGTHVSADHHGFDSLAEPIQFAERKRYAGYWAAFLAELEMSTCPGMAAAASR